MTDNIIDFERILRQHNEAAQGRGDFSPVWTVRIDNEGGYTEVESHSFERAVYQVVDLCVRAGERPKLRWWQFNRIEWPDACVTEYLKQT